MSFSMDQAKNWYRWATEKKRNARARGEMGKSPRTMGRRGLAGNLGQPNALEIYQAVYDENVAAAAAANARQRYSEANARANGYSPTMMTSSRTRRAPAQVNSNRVSMARNLPTQFVQLNNIRTNIRNNNDAEDPTAPEETIPRINSTMVTRAILPDYKTPRRPNIFALPTSGGKFRRARKTRKARKSSRRSCTRAHRR